MKSKLTNVLTACVAMLLLFSGCKKNKGEEASDSPYYFIATIDGKNIKYEADDLSSRYECGISFPTSASGTDYDIYEGTFIADAANPNANKIYVHMLKYFDHYPDYDERLVMIKVGQYAYGKSERSTATTNGACIRFTDADGNYWDSELGPQTGSSFAITEIEGNDLGTSLKLFKATFSCKLYDGMGGSITVSNAQIKGKAFIP